ncbi:MAG: PAN domain-containing protein [Phyllobacteriaceae bacterium]|nr:PAN domain-containing protein [Phyllobacteriaceae bacterium]
MRLSPLLKKFVFAVALAVLSVGAASAMEFNKNRPGGDFMHFPLVAPLPSQCEAACNSNAACKAWTYVKPGHQGPLSNAGSNRRCRRKSAIRAAFPERRPRRRRRLDFNTDRPGSDFTDVTLPNGSTYKACRTLCNADGDCKAWTFVSRATREASRAAG